jgi:hypothetical protein
LPFHGTQATTPSRSISAKHAKDKAKGALLRHKDSTGQHEAEMASATGLVRTPTGWTGTSPKRWFGATPIMLTTFAFKHLCMSACAIGSSVRRHDSRRNRRGLPRRGRGGQPRGRQGWKPFNASTHHIQAYDDLALRVFAQARLDEQNHRLCLTQERKAKQNQA